MAKPNGPKPVSQLRLPQTSAADLVGKQSVRATFKLTPKAIEALSVVSVHLGIKQKSLFDYLMEDVQALQAVAEDIEPQIFKRRERIQKTYVLSRRSLSSLEKVSKALGTPRDALVEYSILRLMPIISQEQAKHRKRQVFLERVQAHLRDGQALLKEAASLLGTEDPVTQRLASSLREYENTHRELAEFMERCSAIEAF